MDYIFAIAEKLFGQILFFIYDKPRKQTREGATKRKTEASVQPQPKKSPSELNQERLAQINQELSDFNQRTTTPEEMRHTEELKQQEYEAKVAEIEQGLGTQLNAESRDMIHQNMIYGVIKH